jgi:hypothetical protein
MRSWASHAGLKPRVVGALAIVVMAASCGSTGLSVSSTSASRTSTSAIATTPPSTTGATAPEGSSATATSSGTFIPASTPVYEFYSPSQNISCEIDYGTIDTGTATKSVLCETISPPQSAVMSADGSLRTCSGMQCLSNAGLNTPSLAYGDTTGVGPFRCTSTMAAMNCTVTGGKGFSISRAGINPTDG